MQVQNHCSLLPVFGIFESQALFPQAGSQAFTWDAFLAPF